MANSPGREPHFLAPNMRAFYLGIAKLPHKSKRSEMLGPQTRPIPDAANAFKMHSLSAERRQRQRSAKKLAASVSYIQHIALSTKHLKMMVDDKLC